METIVGFISEYFFVFLSICCFSILTFFYGLFLLNLVVKKGSLKATRAKYQKSFICNSSPIETFNAIMQFAKNSGHRIDDYDKDKLGLVLNRKWDLTGNALTSFYTIFVREDEGKTVVDVGITHKLGFNFVLNPLNFPPLERMYNEVRNAVLSTESTT